MQIHKPQTLPLFFFGCFPSRRDGNVIRRGCKALEDNVAAPEIIPHLNHAGSLQKERNRKKTALAFKSLNTRRYETFGRHPLRATRSKFLRRTDRVRCLPEKADGSAPFE